MKKQTLIEDTKIELTKVISETNGISLNDTLELLLYCDRLTDKPTTHKNAIEFKRLLAGFKNNEVDIQTLLNHTFSKSLFLFFKEFPLKFHEEHIHLTGSLSAKFIYPRLKELLDGPNKKVYEDKILEVYGEDSLPIETEEDVDNLIRLSEGEQFSTYLRILYLAKLILNTKEAHKEAAFHMASELYHKYNVGSIRLKFTLSRSTSNSTEQIPGLENITEEDVVLGLYDGFSKFQELNPDFKFILSPSFRKEADFFDNENYKNKSDHFYDQVKNILTIIEKHPQLKNHITEVDTVGDEKNLYRKAHFNEMKAGLRRLQYNGFRIRSHHGETWTILRKGIQSVDNAMNIWHIDTLEHGISLGINPNFYFHRLYQRVMEQNNLGKPLLEKTQEYLEVSDMDWYDPNILEKLLKGVVLTEEERVSFIKTKFHAAREIEHYQHDVLNRMIHKEVSLVSLPTSNLKLTGSFPDYKDHPFSWWEKKGVKLGVGTDNYITLNTNFINEILILLYSDPENLKITKLLMLVTKEKRRPYVSSILWQMRKLVSQKESAPPIIPPTPRPDN